MNSSFKEGNPILEMDHIEARTFFLKHESYCNIGLPDYIDFSDLLNCLKAILEKYLEESSYWSDCSNSAKKEPGVNYLIFKQKGSEYDWRKFQLIHPVLYVIIILELTRNDIWNTVIKNHFKELENDCCIIKCLGLPKEDPQQQRKDSAVQISHWWEEVEQTSIELALNYSHVFHTDISNCYSSLYTHSIEWAFCGKNVAKKLRKKEHSAEYRELLPGFEFGKRLDQLVRAMSQGQTNGISEGSVLMDFIAEIVLRRVDVELFEKIKNIKCHLLRYRDDYRIFVQNPEDGEVILRKLTETLIDYGLRLNSSKTKRSNQVVRDSIKADKYAFLGMRNQYLDAPLHENLIMIHSFSREYPDSGRLRIALADFASRLEGFWRLSFQDPHPNNEGFSNISHEKIIYLNLQADELQYKLYDVNTHLARNAVEIDLDKLSGPFKNFLKKYSNTSEISDAPYLDSHLPEMLRLIEENSCVTLTEKIDESRIMVYISILVDIAYHNANTYKEVGRVLSILFSKITDQSRKVDYEKNKILPAFKRFSTESEYLYIWLQRFLLTQELKENSNSFELVNLVANLKNGNQMQLKLFSRP